MDNCRQFAPLVEDAANQNADLVVLPETLTCMGNGLTYADAAEPIPGPSTKYFGELAKQLTETAASAANDRSSRTTICRPSTVPTSSWSWTRFGRSPGTPS